MATVLHPWQILVAATAGWITRQHETLGEPEVQGIPAAQIGGGAQTVPHVGHRAQRQRGALRIHRELGEVKAGRSAALSHLIADRSSHGDQCRRVGAQVGRRVAP